MTEGAFTPVRLPQTQDIAVQVEYQMEIARQAYPLIRILQLDRSKTVEDPLYREVRSQDAHFKEPIEMYSFVDFEPSRQELKKYGIDESREVMVTFATALLEEKALLGSGSQYMIGWVIEFDDDYYEVLSQHRGKEGFWANTNIPFHVIVTCQRYRFGS